jgi:hypothetical protein
LVIDIGTLKSDRGNAVLVKERRVMMRRVWMSLVTAALFLCATRPATAQPLLNDLSSLLTEQRPTGSFVLDPAAAAATRDTVASLFLVELTQVPIASSSGGFVYQLRPGVGVYSRASNQFGPFFTERTLRSGAGQLSLGMAYQYSDFGSLQGASLDAGTFPTNAARAAGAIDPFSVDLLSLRLISRTYNLFATYGVSDRLSIGGTIPLVSVSFTGERVRTINNTTTVQSTQSAGAAGLGDVVVNGRYLVAGSGSRGFSAGADLRLPTGSKADLRGTGEVAGRVIAIGSREDGRLALHANGGFGFGGVSREVFWSAATGYAATPRVTVIGEVVGRWLSDLTRVSQVYQPNLVSPDVETMRWLPSERGVHTTFVVTGAKWNFTGSWMLNTSLLFRVTDAGLRATVTPGISIDYAIGQLRK